MTHDLKFVLQATDVAKMRSVVFGKRFRPFAICVYGCNLAYALYGIATGANLILHAMMVTTSLVMLFDIQLLYRPYFSFIDTNARVRIDEQHLASSLGAKTYAIPWPFFKQFGSIIDAGDHFYLKSNLGNIYLPKRAFENGHDIERFRNDMTDAIGSLYMTPASEDSAHVAG